MVRVQGDIVEVVVAFAVVIGPAVGGRLARGGVVADPHSALPPVQGEHAAETERRSPPRLSWKKNKKKDSMIQSFWLMPNPTCSLHGRFVSRCMSSTKQSPVYVHTTERRRKLVPRLVRDHSYCTHILLRFDAAGERKRERERERGGDTHYARARERTMEEA